MMKNEVDPGFNRELSAMIDHTLLKPEATADQITKLCQEALQYEFKAVCVNPFWVPLTTMLLKGSKVNICTVLGFPLGAITSEAKADEAREAVRNGATEVDMVINMGALKSGQYDIVLHDINCVVHSVKRSTVVKVILETGLLTDSEKIKACELSKEAGADFVKTSTGFGAGGATVDDVRLMRQTVGEKMGVKASGGIRDYETAMAMIRAGANRIGASAGIAIVTHRLTPSKATMNTAD